MLPGRAVAARNLRALRIAKLPEDFRVQGTADPRSAQHSNYLRIDEDFFPRAGAVARARPSGTGGVGHEEAGANWKSSRRLEPERRTQDHSGGVLAAGAGASHGFNAGDVGRG